MPTCFYIPNRTTLISVDDFINFKSILNVTYIFLKISNLAAEQNIVCCTACG